jgi:ligand-binding SRPBCC domain-containing protein
LINKKTHKIASIFNLPSGIRYLAKETRRAREEEREKKISDLIACIEEYRKEEDHSFAKRAHIVVITNHVSFEYDYSHETEGSTRSADKKVSNLPYSIRLCCLAFEPDA